MNITVYTCQRKNKRNSKRLLLFTIDVRYIRGTEIKRTEIALWFVAVQKLRCVESILGRDRTDKRAC